MRRHRSVLVGLTAVVAFAPGARADVLIPIPLAPTGPLYSIGAQAPSLDDGGDLLAFSAYGDQIVEGDTNGVDDVFVRDLGTGAVRTASVSTAGVLGNGPSFSPRLSGDGSVVIFQSHANDLVRQDQRDCAPDDVVDECRTQLYLHDLVTGATILVTHNAGGRPSRYPGYGPDVSDDGRLVVFYSYAQPLDPQHPASAEQVYLFDRADRSIELVSVSSDGRFAEEGAGGPAISGDGRVVLFTSISDLAPGSGSAMYARDLAAGTTERLPGFGFSDIDISDDGEIVVGTAWADQAILVLDRSDGSTTVMPPPSGTYPQVQSGPLVLSGDGSTVVYTWYDGLYDYPPVHWVIADVVSAEQIDHEWEAKGFSLSADGSLVALESDEADPRQCAQPSSLWLLDRSVPTPDPTPPVFTSPPDVNLGEGRVRDGVPMRIVWEAQDEESLRFFVTRVGPGGGESEDLIRFNTSHFTEQAARDHLRLGHRGLPYGVYACDSTTSTLALAPMFVLHGPQEDSPSVAYDGTWLDRRHPDSWRNGVRVAYGSGAAATLTFDGSQVAWVARRGPGQGAATVSVDGAVVGEVDLAASEWRQGSVVLRWRGSPGPHTLRIVSNGSGPISVDGFAVIEPTDGA